MQSPYLARSEKLTALDKTHSELVKALQMKKNVLSLSAKDFKVQMLLTRLL